MRTQISKMKKAMFAIASLTLLASCQKQKMTELQDPVIKVKGFNNATNNLHEIDYQLIWSDEFNSIGAFDNTKWSYAQRGGPAWAKYLTSSPAYVNQDGNNLVLRMDNATIAGDPVPYHSGGVSSQGKFSATFGKIEVRAKFTQGQGSWPAIWMMPEPATQHGTWPNCGEIDIMEHTNYSSQVYHSIHSAIGSPVFSKPANYQVNDYNIYSLVWTPTSLAFYVNNILTDTYNKAAGADTTQWPFDVPFYIILNQSGGQGWPGPITNADLPFSMQVDYVRVYKKNLLENGGFESSTGLSPWVTWTPGGTSTIVSSDANSGSKSIRLQGAGECSVQQKITGLLPNTTYTFKGYGKLSSAGNFAVVGVKNYGGATIDSNITQTQYEQKTITFTTGVANTSVEVYFYKNNTNGTAYADDFSLVQL